MTRLETSNYSLNSVKIIGRLGQDPEVKYIKSGTAVANLSVATSAKVKDQDKTEWHKVVVWGKAAEFAGNHCSKGDLVSVDGWLETRSWEKDGVKKYSTEIIGFRLDKVNWAVEKAQDRPARHDGDGYPDDVPF